MVKVKQLIVIFSVLISMHSYSMEMPHTQNDYVDFTEEQIEQFSYYIGNIEHLRFYNEYHAQNLPNGKISFKLNNCDPVPLHSFDDLRYFFTSASTGNLPNYGSPLIVEDPAITDIMAVRGRIQFPGSGGEDRIEFYTGLDRRNFIKKGKKKIYPVQILALFAKSTKDVDQARNHYLNSVRAGNSNDLNQKIRKYIEDRKDCGWTKPEWQRIFLELAGEGWIKANSRDVCFMRDEAALGNGKFFSRKVYWTKDENKLKGIKYRK